jgi:hypothetical protein
MTPIDRAMLVYQGVMAAYIRDISKRPVFHPV